MKISTELKSLQKLWKKSEARAQSQSIPDGSYQAKIVSHKIERSKNTNKIQLKCQLRILTGKNKGRSIYKYSQLENPQSMGFVKTDFKSLGIKIPKNIMHLGGVLEETEDMVINCTIKTNGQYTNIYFNEVVGDLDDIEEDDEIEEEDEEDDEETEDDDDEEEEEEITKIALIGQRSFY